MIGSLRGLLDEVVSLGDSVSEIVVDVGGVGYRLSVSTRTVLDLGPPGTSVRLAVHTHMRDSAITLYGFSDRSERRCFEVLVATHGVGPGLALAILGLYRPPELARLVATNDEAALTAVPGVGRKTAARLLVELGTRVEDLTGGVVMIGSGAGDAARAAAAEVGQALAALGYGPDEVRPLLAGLPEEDDPQTLLRQALRQLAAHR
jgi:Holliday junction DNA helicase RuvA